MGMQTEGDVDRGPETRGRRTQLVWYTVRRLALLPVMLASVLILTFLITSVLPVDTARAIAGPMADDGMIDKIRTDLGLDRPMGERLANWVTMLLHGDLGESYVTHRPVWTELVQKLPATLSLVIPSLLLAALIGIAVGALLAYFRNSRLARWTDRLVSLMQAIPDFLGALLLVLLFATVLHWLPGPEGQLSIGTRPPPNGTGVILIDALINGELTIAFDAMVHLVIPVTTLALANSVLFARLSEALLTKALRTQFIQFGRAAGWSEWRVIRGAILAARVPLLTYSAMLLASLMGGVAIVETIFSWGGIGQWTIESMQRVDLPAIQGIVLLAGGLTMVIYLLTDTASAFLDSRISLGNAE